MVAWAAHRIPGAITESECRSYHKGRGIEPLRRAPLASGQIRISNAVRPLRSIAREGVEIGNLRDCERHARLQLYNAADVPSPGKSIFPASEREWPPFAERKLINEACCEDMRNVAVRQIFFEMPIVTVGHGKVGHRPGEDGGIEHRRSVVDQFGEGIGSGQSKPG